MFDLTVSMKTDRVFSKKNNFLLLCCLFRQAKTQQSKFEANLMHSLQARFTSSSLFPLVSSSLNDYFHAYAIIDFIANQLVFINMITYIFSVVSEIIKIMAI